MRPYLVLHTPFLTKEGLTKIEGFNIEIHDLGFAFGLYRLPKDHIVAVRLVAIDCMGILTS
jgi:hypothetical protein